MSADSREWILSRLRSAPGRGQSSPQRSPLPLLSALGSDRDRLLETFRQKLEGVKGEFHHIEDREALYAKLEELFKANEVRRAVAADDSVLAPLELARWAAGIGVELRTPANFADPAAFKEAVFLGADAGLTGADFLMASTGTLVLAHDRSQARLISLAPILHIVVAPADRLVADYEPVVAALYEAGNPAPSQTTLITGPSSTADIQATPFTGMHGPRRLIVIVAARL